MRISDAAREAVWQAERSAAQAFMRADAVESAVQQRVLEAFWAERVSSAHFAPSTGYGYDDVARDTFDRVFAHAVQAERALVRPQIVNGTHAIFLAIRGVSEPGDTILSISGEPYDTMRTALGLTGNAPHSLQKSGVHFRSVPLDENGCVQIETVSDVLLQDASIRVVYAQRSRGYAWRGALTIDALRKAFDAIRSVRPDVTIFVDNCYGEFVEVNEPTGIGADLIAGSMIKNPGGGLAPTGGYIAGRADYVERAAQCLTVPGMGAEVGSYAASYRPYYQGLFMAPHTSAQCIKFSLLLSSLFAQMGYDTMPGLADVRSDIIQAIRFADRDALLRFCRCIQKAAPVDAFAVPEPWDMPGYADQIVMAAGTFVQGSTSELSADAPIREPYTAYVQGALTYAHGRIAAMLAYDAVRSELSE